MRRSSLTSRWVVLPTALAAAALATAVTMASASPDGDRAAVARALAAEQAGAAPAPADRAADPDRSAATTRRSRAFLSRLKCADDRCRATVFQDFEKAGPLGTHPRAGAGESLRRPGGVGPPDGAIGKLKEID